MTDKGVNVHHEPAFCVYKIIAFLFLFVHMYRCIILLCMSVHFCIINVFVCSHVYTNVYLNWCVCVCSYSVRAVNGREFAF